MISFWYQPKLDKQTLSPFLSLSHTHTHTNKHTHSLSLSVKSTETRKIVKGPSSTIAAWLSEHISPPPKGENGRMQCVLVYMCVCEAEREREREREIEIKTMCV